MADNVEEITIVCKRGIVRIINDGRMMMMACVENDGVGIDDVEADDVETDGVDNPGKSTNMLKKSLPRAQSHCSIKMIDKDDYSKNVPENPACCS